MAATKAKAKAKGDPGERAVEPEERSACEATVKVTGDKKARWSGEAYVVTGGDLQAFYKTTKGKTALSIYTEADDSPAYAVLTAGKTTYTTQPGEGTVDVDPDGGGAEIDAEATGVGAGDAVRVVATVEC